MRMRIAKKVFLRASKGWTGHKRSTLAVAARKVTGQHVPASAVWVLFTLMWLPKRWPPLREMFDDWLSIEHPTVNPIA